MVLRLARVDDWVTLKTHNAFANVIRLGIKPTSYRKYDKSTGQWYVHKTQVPSLLGLAKKFYTEVDTNEIPSAWISGGSEKPSKSYEALYLSPGAPQPVVRAVYETLTTMYHPDHNDGVGDPTRLQEVIAAYREIIKTFKVD